jgi:histidinol-phosphatase
VSVPFGPEWSASLARVPAATLREWLALAHAACDEADAIALEAFRRDIRVDRKPDRTFVTAADEAVERAVRGRIEAAYPAHGLVGEEYGEARGSAPVRWYIDPIDGTHNFMRGVPVFATLLGVEADGELQLGMISAPALGSRWWAARGLGSWGRTPGGSGAPIERPLRVSGIEDLGVGHVLHSSRRDALGSGKMPGFDAVVDASWRDRGFGDFWGYVLVAEGAAEVMVETGLHPYDLAAPVVIVEEAGGRLTDHAGERRIDSRSAVATNGTIHDEVLRRLRG